MSDTPQLLLAHHLKALKLPTFLREYDKLAGTGLVTPVMRVLDVEIDL